jgi:hypothetical protein
VTAISARNDVLLREGQFAPYIAAPEHNMEDPNRHQSKLLYKECGWKQGESAVANKAAT